MNTITKWIVKNHLIVRVEALKHYIEDCENYNYIREQCKMKLYQITGIFDFTEDTFLSVSQEEDIKQQTYGIMEVFDTYITEIQNSLKVIVGHIFETSIKCLCFIRSQRNFVCMFFKPF